MTNSNLSQLAHFIADGVEILIDNKSGEAFTSISGYGRMAGKDKSTISRRVKGVAPSRQKTTTILTPGGPQEVVVISEDQIVEWIVQDNPKLAVQMMKAGVRVFLHKMAGFEITSTALKEKPLQNIVWWQRLILFKRTHNIPEDYFSVFGELTCGLISDFEVAGYVMPEHSCIDIAVGIHWSKFLKSKGKDMNAIRIPYRHVYPDGREVDAFAYTIDLLPDFKRWMAGSYKSKLLEGYLKKRDPQALVFLAELMGWNTQQNLFTQAGIQIA
jgi:hypothetical protein